MKYTHRWLLLTFTAICFAGVASTQAQPITPRNPFRSYSISGINYGSQQWEKANRQPQPATPQRERRIFNRRRS